jgi:hypothetical protein
LHHATGLGAAVTDVFRQEARQEGWYGARRGFQRHIVSLIVPLGFAMLALLIWLLRTSWRRYLPAAFALVVLLGFGGLQLISLHDVDARMHTRWLGANLGTWLNGMGLLLAAGALCWSYAEGLRLRSLAPTRPRRHPRAA